MTPRSRGILLIIGATLCWSSESLWVRLVSADDWQILFWSAIVMTIALGGWLFAQYGRGLAGALRRTGRPGIVAAVSVAIAYTGFIFALNRTTVANTVVLLATAPLVAALLARFVLGERVRRRTWIAMGAAFAGVLVMVSDSLGGGQLIGDLLALATGAVYAINIVALRAAPVHDGEPTDMIPPNATGGLIIAAVATSQADITAVSGADLGILVMIGLVSLALGTWLFTRGVRHVQAAEAGLICLTEAAVAPLLVWLVLSETPTPQALAGAAIILAAVVFETLPERRSAVAGD